MKKKRYTVTWTEHHIRKNIMAVDEVEAISIAGEGMKGNVSDTWDSSHTFEFTEHKLEPLNDKTDSMLMMEFRGQNWNAWVKFCKEQGYHPTMEDD